MSGRHRIDPEAELQVALAEFSALRDEILSVRSVQKNVTSIALTAYAAVLSVASVSEDNRSLLLVLPPLGLGLCLIQLGETVTIGRIGRYIQTDIWESVELSGYPHSWEARPRGYNLFQRLLIATMTDFMLPLMMTVAGVAAIVLAPASDSVKWLEGIAVAATFVAPIVLGVVWLRWRPTPEPTIPDSSAE